VNDTEITQAVNDQCAAECVRLGLLLAGRVRRQRTLLDAPALDFDLRPFLMPPGKGEPQQFVLSPTPADAGPFSLMLMELMARP
jgi:hypothetical protein